MTHITFFQDILLLLPEASVMSPIANRLHVSSAVMSLIGSAAIGLACRFPTIQINLGVALVVPLTPLLMSSAFYTARRQFLTRIVLFARRALGSVILATAVVACVASWFDSYLRWPTRIMLGVIVSLPLANRRQGAAALAGAAGATGHPFQGRGPRHRRVGLSRSAGSRPQ